MCNIVNLFVRPGFGKNEAKKYRNFDYDFLKKVPHIQWF